jgi:glycerol-3-phosphate dehydrogenase
VRDPQAAAECYRENQTLRRIMPHCLEELDGFFVLTPWEDPDYIPGFLAGCQAAGIPVEEVGAGQLLRQEPALNPGISYCFRTPDISGDPFLSTQSNADSARQHGARILTYHRVLKLWQEQGQVQGAHCRDLINDEEVTVRSALVVNAAGVWAGRLAASIGLSIPLLPSKGAMLALNQRVLNSLVLRCHIPSDADALIPSHTVTLTGSTDGDICQPDDVSINPQHIQVIMQEAEKLVPGISSVRRLRAWAGVRPLYAEDVPAGDTRRVTRAHALLDHAARDGMPGLITIIGGKWTTYRLMAEEVTDLACKKLGVPRTCRTHLEALPGADGPRPYRRGAALQHVEDAAQHSDLICECELVTSAGVEQSILSGQARTLDDLRRLRRVGMGPCQGGYCVYRAAGMLRQFQPPPIRHSNRALLEFLQERWKGQAAVLAGQQLRQARLNELIYRDVLNADHLPGAG